MMILFFFALAAVRSSLHNNVKKPEADSISEMKSGASLCVLLWPWHEESQVHCSAILFSYQCLIDLHTPRSHISPEGTQSYIDPLSITAMEHWIIYPNSVPHWSIHLGFIAYGSINDPGGGGNPIWKGRGCSSYRLGVKISGSGTA